MTIAVLGIDLGKNSCSLVGLDAAGRVVLRRRMQREGVIAFGAKLPGCVVAMEACCGAHHMGRALAKQGHTIRLMSPEYVRPYVKAQKNDDPRRRGHRRSGHTPDDALRGTQVRVAARRADPAPGARPARGRAHGADQPDPLRPAGAWPRRGAGARQAHRCLAALLDTDAGASLTHRACEPSWRGARTLAGSRPAHRRARRRVRRARPASTRTLVG